MDINLDHQRRLNRTYAGLLGLFLGIVLAILDHLLRFSAAIRQIEQIPWYLRGITLAVFSSMLLGASAALILTLIRTRAIPLLLERWPSRWTFEAMLFGAVGTVVWWVVPIALLFLTGSVLYGLSLTCGMVTAQVVKLIWGFQSSIRWFYGGLYLGGALGGGVFGWSSGKFLVGLIRELLGKPAWTNRQHIRVGILVGIALGTVYGIVFVRLCMTWWLLD